MVEPTAPEVAAKAVVQESIGPTPVRGSAEAAAARLVEGLTSSNWREKLKIASSPEVDRKRIAGKIEQIGTDRDPTTGARLRTPGSPEAQRHDDAAEHAKLDFKFVEKGYAGLTDSEKTKVRTAVENMTLQNPLLAAEYSSLNIAQKKAYLERKCSDPVLAGEVRNALVELAGGDSLADTVATKKDQLEERNTALNIKTEEKKDVQRRIDSVQRRLDNFDRTTTPPGRNAQEIDRIRGGLSNLQTEADGYKDKINEHNYKLARLEREREGSFQRGWNGRTTVDIERDIDDIRLTKLKQDQDEYNKRMADINKLPQLEQEEQRLEESKATLESEKHQKELEEGKLSIEVSQRQREYEDMRALRESMEKDLVDGLDGVFSEAARKTLNKEMEAAAGQCEEVLKKLEDETTDERQKEYYKQLQKRWTTTVKRFGRKEVRRPIVKLKVEQDYSELMTNGPEALTRRILESTVKPGTRDATHPDGVPYTPDEVRELLANTDNKEMLATLQSQAIEQLLAKKVLAGGISKDDAYVIANTEWGRGVITKALERNDEARKQVEELMGHDALKSPDFMDRFAREVGSRSNLLWMILLAGAGVVRGVAMPAEAAIRAAREEQPYI